MMNMGYKPRSNSCTECQRMLNEIGKIDFVIKELNLYLDTHPYDQTAMENFNYYNGMKNDLVNEYTQIYGPIVLSAYSADSNEWKWATQNWPWTISSSNREGGYY